VSTPAISLERLTKHYGKRRGIEDVNLAIDDGEVFGFIGPNGAGKSTTIRLLLGLMRPTAGTAKIFGETVHLSANAIKREIGYLPSEVHLYGDMRVRDLLQYSAAFYADRKTADPEELAERLDVDLSQRIDRLSLGNRKKVGIMQAVLHHPRLLILDEPTSGLDPLIQTRFFELLTDLNASGTTVFFSSHVLSEVQRLCHRVAILKEGRVIAVEEVDALRSRSVKKVSVEWKDQAVGWRPADAKDIQESDHRVSFLYQGHPQALLTDLGQHSADVLDIEIEQPSLEEVFLHFYGKGE
jgi:ABC-2 type transport system ATP-binding protein